MKILYSALLCAIATTGATAQSGGTAPAAKQHFTPVHGTPLPQTQRDEPLWEDDFSDPGTWVIGNEVGNDDDWVIGTGAPSGAYAIDPIASTTAANGFALFDSDLLCSGNQNAWVRNADPIDLTGEPYVMLQFEQFYRNFEGQTLVEVSTDGTNWSSIQINGGLDVNLATPNPDLLSIPISQYAGDQSTVWIRFRYTGGCDYAWMVDDVAIVAQPLHNMSITTAASTAWDLPTVTYDSLPYTIFPVPELRPLGLNMVYVNNGALEAENVVATITTSDGYSESQNLGNMAPNDTIHYYAPAYTPTTTIGDHSIYFSVSSDNTDEVLMDNADTLTITVSDHIFGQDQNSLDGRMDNDGDEFYAGSFMHVIADEMLYGIDVAIYDESDAGIEVNALLMDADRAPLAETMFYTTLAGDMCAPGEGKFVSLIFETPQELSAGTDYFISFHHFGGAPMGIGTSGNSPVGAASYMSLPDETWYVMTSTPMIRMNFNPSVGISENDIQNGIGLGQNIPNPAKDMSYVNFSLENSAAVTMELYDVSGKLVRTLVQGTMAPGTHRVDINTSDLQDGVYFYTLTTNNAIATKRMTVVH